MVMTPDEYHLATLGYKQTFVRSFGIVENWAATVNTMNFVSALPMMYGFAMYTGGPQAAFANWTMVGGLALMVSLSMIAATFPTCGGIYFWSFRLGGPVWGPFLSWFTAWFNWAGWVILIPGVAQGNTYFLLSALQILYPNSEVISKAWFSWLLAISTILISFMANSTDRRARGHFQPASILTEFYNGINMGPEKQASDAYCWIVGILYGACDFYGFDAAVHLAEQTEEASSVVARGMWLGTLVTWLVSVPTLLLILFCTPSFTDIVDATYPNSFAAYLVSLAGSSGAVTILIILWLDGILGTTIIFLSPFHPHPVAFDALSAAATAIVNFSYLIPILARHSIGHQSLNYAPIIVAGISLVSLGGWFAPFKLGARYWFQGPRRTISEAELREISVLEDKDA
ncbi:hypothetical protein BDV97DRAFT_378545 [Delphinella strobiligena]|nr:hypothetical protein BDV97DRAFT_378545 [Delphinella strobiligena]